jgi:tRNA(adenine34) deaminase
VALMARHATTTPRRWSHEVATASTFPPEGLFTRDARTIAETMARPEVSPGGLGPAIRMVTFFINRAGRALAEDRRAELEAAKRLLRERKAAAPVVPPAQRAPGRYRHRALGPVTVEKRGRTWWMVHRPGHPPIALGPDGWCYLEPDRGGR